MIPGVLAQDVADALREFIVTGFETDTWPFQGKFEELVRSQEGGAAFLKGPYVSISLPFAKQSEGKDFFGGFETEHSPFVHQEQAWQRLRSDNAPRSTIIATGTGSGKTECFLYPLLDHCRRNPGPGVKAVIIYPMNALAGDQAKRFASVIHDAPALKGAVRVGLFIGGEDDKKQVTMTAEQVITCKATMRNKPPDILLTNYKMLDFLLMRPGDQELWQYNGPETLRYLVVDELHTFDGAQGSDLAMLIRRLRARLGVERGQVCCIGTSATLGDPSAGPELAAYATEIFDADFDRDSIVGESRESHEQFLGMLQDLFLDPSFAREGLEMVHHDSPGDFLRAQVRLFFSDWTDFNPESEEDRRRLGARLRGHVVLYNVLRAAGTGPVALEDLLPAIQNQVPASLKDHGLQVLMALLALLGHARGARYPGEPFVTLRVQLWARELRRIVARVGNDSAQYPVYLRFADDIKQAKRDIYLPVVQCNECHATAWLTGQAVGEERIQQDLRQIYNWFFENHRASKVLLPLEAGEKPPPMAGAVRSLCSQCGRLVAEGKECVGCEPQALVRVFEPVLTRERRRGGVRELESERTCPVCQAENSLLLFGSRAASLCSVAIHQLFADPVNDDKKLIAFSDSVQDAAHRAGFFAARTWQNNLRMGLAKALNARGGETLPLQELYDYFPRFWLESDQNPERFDPLRYIAEFVAPNLQSAYDYLRLKESGTLENPASFIAFINKRLAWEILTEFGARSPIGRSLERTGIAVLSWDPALIDGAAQALVWACREKLGYELDLAVARQMLWGIALRMKRQGAIYDPVFESYIKDGGNEFLLSRRQIRYMPHKVPYASLPRFPAEQREKGFDALLPGKQKTWYSRWVMHLTREGGLHGESFEKDLLREVMAALVQSGLALALRSKKDTALWALNPAQLGVTTKLGGLRLRRPIGPGKASESGENGDASGSAYGSWYVPEAWVAHLEGMPSLDYVAHGGPTPARFERNEHPRPSLYQRLYLEGALRRVIGHEHTALLERKEREALEHRFMAETAQRQPWHENLLSATPTLEMGIDIGDLSSVMLCSVPPSGANYLQRAGRGGRRDGNAFVMTLANARPHDLYFFADPMRMLAGRIEAPAIFLNAVMVLRRQLLAFCFDQWGMAADGNQKIPRNMQEVLNAVETNDMGRFPHTLLDFVDKRRDELWDRFEGLLGGSVSEATRARLKAYLLATGKEGGMRVYLVERLQESVRERAALHQHQKELQSALKTLKKMPQDEARDKQIKELEDELEQIKRLRMGINTRQTLQYFTDEGLLPNYAFPEEGTTLRSVIYRKLDKEATGKGGQGSKYDSRIYEYSRPAHAALSELAPESIFYASTRRVEIDRVELANGDLLEDWRLCPSCSYSEHIKGAESGGSCPRCHDPMWFDVQQRMHLVRLRQVYANTPEEHAFIGDDSETREPTFYNQQMLVNIDREDITLAYATKTDTRAFGFEFARKASFREINFGKQNGTDQSFKVAGEELSRPGFRLCKGCGMVQKSGNKRPHLFRCQYRDGEPGAGIVDCLYLYRQYESEAIRILMPRFSVGQADEQRQSFVAAIQLGLKEHFRGKVDHLNIMTCDEPIPGTEERTHYLVLYDTVPGGTGYLHTLLHDPEEMMAMLRKSRDVMAKCRCQEEPDRDGCYNCLYAYKNSYGMEQTSRRTALAMLADILDENIELVQVSGLDKVNKHSWADSELERRFPEAVESMAQSQHLKGLRVRISKDVIHGKVGFKLEVGTLIYTVEPHARLGPKDGVAYPCEPDFLLTLDRESNQSVKVAVFLDGWKHHKESVQVDLMKRQGIFLGTQTLTWSLTWHDLSQTFAGNELKVPNVYREQTEHAHPKLMEELGRRLAISDETRMLEMPQLALLLRFLADPNRDAWRNRAMMQAFRWVNQQRLRDAAQAAAFRAAARLWPSRYQEAYDDASLCFWSVTAWQHPAAELSIHIAGTQEVTKNLMVDGLVFCVVCDLKQLEDEQALRTWQRLLQVLNLGQFLPLFFAGTPQGIQDGHFAQLDWGTKEQKAVAGPWEKIFYLVDEDARDVVALLAKQDIAAPTVGYELADGRGKTIAEGELAWEEARIVLLLDYQQDEFGKIFQDHGWKAFSPEEKDAMLRALTGAEA